MTSIILLEAGTKLILFGKLN